MGPSANSRFAVRQVCVLIVALLSAGKPLAPAQGAQGETDAWPNVDEDPGGATHVARELLVLYEPGIPAETERDVVRRSVGRTLKDLPGKVRLVTFPAVRRARSGARERALQRKLEGLRNEPRVEAVDCNYVRRASFIPDEKFGAQWGLHTAHFPGTWNGVRGAGAKIAIVDSGIDKSHPDIGKIAAQKNFFNGDTVVKDRYGHGNRVVGIAATLTNNDRGVTGGCPACKLLVVKVMDPSRGVKDSNLLAGIKWSVNYRADVINPSLGAPGRSSVFEATIDKAYANGKGAVGVTAAGNEGTPRKQYPAAYPAAIAVSATNNNDKLASFSSRGDWVDLAAPGTRILSTRAAIAGGGYGRESGTSESVPFVSAHAGCSPPKARRPAGSTNACKIPPPTWGPPASAHTTGTAGSTPTGPYLSLQRGLGPLCKRWSAAQQVGISARATS